MDSFGGSSRLECESLLLNWMKPLSVYDSCVRSGLNSHCFPMVGVVINLIVGVYTPIIRIPIKGWMSIPNTRSLDPGTCGTGMTRFPKDASELEKHLEMQLRAVARSVKSYGRNNPQFIYR